jgi:soluble lytic murein transglycosylase-like protein
MKKIITAIIILFSTITLSQAEDMMCYERAAREYQVSPQILKAISKVESTHNPRALHVNTNNTIDAGHMQINSEWGSVLKRNYNYLYNPCYNTRVGAWVLKQCMIKYGNTWDAVACYHTGPGLLKTEDKLNSGAVYARKIQRALAAEEH